MNITDNFTDNFTDYPTTLNVSNTSTAGAMVDYLITKEQYEVSRMVIYMVILPIVTLIGIFGNSISLYILNKYPTNHAFCTYLKALTCVDTLLLTVAFIRFIFKVLEKTVVQYGSKLETYVTFYTSLALGTLLQRMSSTLITIISLERLLAVALPFKIRTMVIDTCPVRFIVAVIIFHVLLQIPSFLLVHVEEVGPPEARVYIISRTDLAMRISAFTTGYLFALAIIGNAVPMVLVVISTGSIIIKVSRKKHIDLLKYKINRGSMEKERMTLTLIVMATFFTILSVPTTATYILSVMENSPRFVFFKALLSDINIILMCTNAASDFVSYCLTSKRFRCFFLKQVSTIIKVRTSSQGTEDSEIQTVSSVSRKTRSSIETSDTYITVNTSV